MNMYSYAAIAIIIVASGVNMSCILDCSSEAAEGKSDSTMITEDGAGGYFSMGSDSNYFNVSEEPEDGSLPTDEVERKQDTAPAETVEMPADRTVSQGELVCLREGKKVLMPLVNTHVEGEASGFLARVHVTQKFINTMDTTIEAIYIFPLPENSAVDSMIMTIGNNRIRGEIKKREVARAIYEQARREGKTASLLEQERPNIFTQSLANILAGDTILITISYVQELKFEEGKFHFNFPMVVGPRYIPGTPTATASRGTESPTDQVPDAHRITPPLIRPDTRNGHSISLTLTINSSPAMIESPSHRIRIVKKSGKVRMIRIMPEDQIPNKDFILTYAVSEDEMRPVVLTHRNGDEGYLQVVMVPQCRVKEPDIIPRELVFVVDNSGSMGGDPIAKCREVMRQCLRNMRPDDRFRVIRFAGRADELSTHPLRASESNVEKAIGFVAMMRGGGGTEMLTAINAIFDTPATDGRKRLVLFMTDGFIGNDKEILSAIRERLGATRIFSLGVGSSVNRYLLEGMGYAGRGECMIIRHDGDAEKVMKAFYRRIDAPLLTDISVTTKGIRLYDQQPALLPDLFSERPVVFSAKYGKARKGSITITGKSAGGKTWKKTLKVALPKKQIENGVITTLWARCKIREIDLKGSRYYNEVLPDGKTAELLITDLGLKYRIMTQFTSFVAVADAVRNSSGKWVSVEQPVSLPEGCSEDSQPAHRYSSPKSKKKLKGCLGGGGDPRVRSGYSAGIDAILHGVGGMKAGGSGGVGRKGTAGIGYGAGYGSGFGGGGGVAALIGSSGLKKRGALTISAPRFTKGGALTGGRSKASIMRVVMQNLPALRYIYNKRLREKPGLQGKITVKFAIDEYGTVIFCKVEGTTMNDPVLEKAVIEKIKRWRFEKLDKPGDITEIVYPFVFSQ